MRTVVLLMAFMVSPILWAQEAEQLEADQWFVGELNGQPAVSLHEVCSRRGDGSRTSAITMAMVIKRTLGKATDTTSRFEVRDAQVFEEDVGGAISSFKFDHEEGGTRTSATGAVRDVATTDATGREVVATIYRLGRKTDVRLPIPEGAVLVGDRRSQELLSKKEHTTGERERFTSVGLVNNSVTLITSTATFAGHDDRGQLLFDVISDVMPIPMRMRLTPKGELAGMTMNLVMFALELKPSDGPVALLGADLSPTGLVATKGAAPRPTPINHYRLPPSGVAAEDEFQHAADGILAVTSAAAPSTLDDRAPLLAAEPHLELDDPEMRAWVTDIASEHATDPAGLAEHLRLAVRSHISVKDLSTGDGTALETFRSRRGDCTEHAALLCAALRIAGIPARIEVGLVFSADHDGWVGHAWNSAYIGDRWIHLDSAYPGVARSCYIKLASATGADRPGAQLFANLATVAGKEIETLAE